MRYWKKIWRIFKVILAIYLIYALFTGVFIFLIDYPAVDSSRDTSEFYGNKTGPDRAALIEDPEFALATRVNLLENAEESVKIANYSIDSDEVTDLFYGLILDTANRGVEVQLLFNDMPRNLYGPFNPTYWAIVNHPHIELRFYEPFSLLKPWTFNNRMYDKFWIVDGTYALSGGRNIGDRYYLEDVPEAKVYDRDILVYNTDSELETSGLQDFELYFEELWNHDYTEEENPDYASFYQNLAQEGEVELVTELEQARVYEQYGLAKAINWHDLSYPTHKVSLISNPLQRLKKKPVILETLNALTLEAEKQIIAQSPYFVVNEELQEIVDIENSEAEVHVLTNSQFSTPNLPAMAGMLNYREDLLEGAAQVYGYQGEGSIHGKSYLIDQRLSLVGSFNIDPRSTFLSTENLVVVDSAPFAQALTKNIESIMQESRIYNAEAPTLPETVEEPKEVPAIKEFFINISRVFFYPLDELL